uniref:K Homology domain-containing protein n=1 Tax=Anopheles albimanus TaxID=7167 RepID=A0A182FMG1_ANOAL
MDDFTHTLDDNRQVLTVGTNGTTLAQLSSQFEDLHVGNSDVTAVNLLNGLVGVCGSTNGGGGSMSGGHHGTLGQLGNGEPAGIAGGVAAALLERSNRLSNVLCSGGGGGGNSGAGGGGVGGGSSYGGQPNGSNVLDTFVAMVSELAVTNTPNVGPISNSTGSSASLGKLEERPVKYKSHTECVPVPSSEHVAEIVGRQGCKIKALRAKTNTFIKTPIRGEEPIFVITGTKEDVTRAKQEILSAADHFSTLRSSKKQAIALLAENRNVLGYNMPDEITIQIRVPQKVVGLVVGPKGATIKNIQLKTNTYIITPKRNQESVFEITGLPTNVHTARQLIEEHIATRAGSTATSGTGVGNGLGSNNAGSGNSSSSSSSSSSSTTSSSSGSSPSLSGSPSAGLKGSGSNMAGSGGKGPIPLNNLSGCLSPDVNGMLSEVGGLSASSLSGLLPGVGEHDYENNQFFIDNLLEYINNMVGSTAYLAGSNSAAAVSNAGGAASENIPDFRSIWENLSESQASGTDTDNSSLVWTLPSSSRNSVSYSPDDFIFQR